MHRNVGTLLLVAAILAAPGISEAQSGWKAGAAKVDITPQEPVWLAGYANRTRPSEGVLQNIYVKALALQDETGKTSVIVTSDLVGLSRSMVAAIEQQARQKYGLTPDRLILNYSHNHSCPVTGEVLHLYYDLNADQTAAIERYTRRLLGQILDVIGSSIQNLAPATISFGQGLAGFAVNRRRSRPDARHLPGPVDPDVPVLAVRAPGGSLRAVLFGYSCHNTALGRYEVSGDYAGYAQEALEKIYPGAVALFMEGCGGDQNPLPRYHQGDNPELAHYAVELATMYGRILAAAVDLALHDDMKPIAGPLSTARDNAQVPFQKAPTRAELETRLSAAKSDLQRRDIAYLLRQLDSDGKLPDHAPYPLAVWQFGRGLTLIALSGEPVADYCLRFKRTYGWDSTWVAGYNNVLLAYIPSLRVVNEGGYEGGDGVYEYGLPAPFGHAIEETIAEKVDELVRQARGSGRR